MIGERDANLFQLWVTQDVSQSLFHNAALPQVHAPCQQPTSAPHYLLLNTAEILRAPVLSTIVILCLILNLKLMTFDMMILMVSWI